MKTTKIWQKILECTYNYLLFFGLSAMIVTGSLMLFVSIIVETTGVQLTSENIEKAAKLTFANTMLLSFIFTVIDNIRRKLTTQRVMRHIAEAAKNVVEGDFTVRISPVRSYATDDNLNEIIDCFNTMTQELGSVETLRTDFISNVSHELKTPLAVMQNYATLLKIPELDDSKRMEYANAIAEQTRRMADMMTNILKLNRLEKQQIYPANNEYDLTEQLCEALLAYENVWEKKNIEISTEIEENVTVKTDRELLGLVWNNLFSNAFKFTPDGGCVTLRLTTDEHAAIVKVTDTGCGISAEVGEHIFEKFYQGDTSHASQGNGLGLALVKRVVDILHGEITVESTVGEGTTFTVRFERCI